jgi:ADP-ribosylglycohydrolase/predicted protein tyrosine phosphatase
LSKLTSDNSPIGLHLLPADALNLAGRLGVTMAPGKKGPGINTRGDWDRDLLKDLERLKTVHGASVLVCLLEPAEMNYLQIPELVEVARELGFQVLRLPIRDVSVPDSAERLRELVGDILTAASQGKTVAIHCRGGFGRSGLVAACCLVARGLEPEQAIRLVRQTRPGAIETPAQAQAVRDFRLRSRFLGCLLGGAVGDALGYPIEFRSTDAIEQRFGRQPPQALDYAHPGEAPVSDDTQMTLFVAEGLIRALQRSRARGLAGAVAAVQGALLRWYDTQTSSFSEMSPRRDQPWRNGWLRTEARLYCPRAPGNTCMSALQTLARGTPASNDSKGCGAVMRSAPFGLAGPAREPAFQAACQSGFQTHMHPLGYLPAGYVAAVVFDVARGMPLTDAMTHADDLLRREAAEGQSPGADIARHRAGARALLDWTRRAREPANGALAADDIERLGAGWTGEEALAISLLCALSVKEGNPDSVARALWVSVAHGGDSDSTGAITGNLLGAIWGIEALPRAWVERVELRDTIERLAGDLFAAASSELELDRDAYPPG